MLRECDVNEERAPSLVQRAVYGVKEMWQPKVVSAEVAMRPKEQAAFCPAKTEAQDA